MQGVQLYTWRSKLHPRLTCVRDMLSPGYDIPGADLLPHPLYGTVSELAAACAANASCVAFTSTGRRGALKGGAAINRTALLSASATLAPACTYIKYTGASCAACVQWQLLMGSVRCH